MTESPVRSAAFPSSLRTKQEHLFVNNVRFLSMAAVVAIHCIGGFWEVGGGDPMSPASFALTQIFKFGTIGFFLISGFLMGEGLTTRAAGEYLKRRLHTVFMPWLLWFGFFCALIFSKALYSRKFDPTSLGAMLSALKGIVGRCMFDSVYWFVPNLMLSIILLLLFKRFLSDPRFGIALLAVSLFYSANIYRRWVPVTSHTQTLIGFAFYLWLGVWASRNYSRVQDWIANLPPPTLLCTLLLTYIAAYAESRELLSLGHADALNTLRLSNQLYSVAAVLAILKLRKKASPSFLNVRTGTFCIYLTHPISVVALLSVMKHAFPEGRIGHAGSGATILPLMLAGFVFVFIYLSSSLFTMWLDQLPNLRWIIGNFARDQMAASVSVRSQLRLKTD